MAFRNDDPDALTDANGTGKDGYTDGTPGVDAPTPARAVDLNMLQEEVCNAVEGLGVTLTASRAGADQAQLLRGITKTLALTGVMNETKLPDIPNEALLASAFNADGTRAVVVGNSVTGGSLVIYSSNPPESWDQATPVGSEDPMLSVAFFNDTTACAVGISGKVMTGFSSWTVRTTGFEPATLADVCYSPSLTMLLAVGVGSLVISSIDGGVTWSDATPAGATGADYACCDWVAALGLFVIAGDSGEIWTSPDGSSWTKRTAAGGFTGSFTNIASLANGTVALTGTEDQYSTDGMSWFTSTVVGTSPTNVAAYGGMFIGTFNRLRHYSEDGATWYELPSNGKTNVNGALSASNFCVLFPGYGELSHSLNIWFAS